MKQAKTKLLIPITLLGGIAASMLMKVLYATGLDHKGLLVRSHPAFAGIWALTALMGLIALLCSRSLGRARGWEANFSRSIVGGLLCLPLAAVFAWTGIRSIPTAGEILDVAVMAASLVSALALLHLGLCRIRGTRPHYLAFCLLCICFGLRLVNHYRAWSSDPQLMDYVFYLLCHVCLMLASYRLAHCAAGGSCRKLPFPVLFGAYLGLAALPQCSDPLFMGACAAWILSFLPREEG